jgi:hypothetical protein
MTASGRAGLAALLTVGMVLCTISRSVKIAGHPAMVPACVSEADKAALKDSLVGRQVSRLLPDALRLLAPLALLATSHLHKIVEA